MWSRLQRYLRKLPMGSVPVLSTNTRGVIFVILSQRVARPTSGDSTNFGPRFKLTKLLTPNTTYKQNIPPPSTFATFLTNILKKYNCTNAVLDYFMNTYSAFTFSSLKALTKTSFWKVVNFLSQCPLPLQLPSSSCTGSGGSGPYFSQLSGLACMVRSPAHSRQTY